MARHVLFALLVITSSSCVGCRSVTSTLLNRTDNDVFVGNSNGDPNYACSAHPFEGVPITIRVPTHLDVAIKETIFLIPNGDTLTRASTDHRQLSVEPTIVETDKVFTVDVKRPGAGTLDYTMTFGSKTATADNTQYFTELKDNITDKTIQDVNAALQTVLPLLQRTAATGKQTAAPVAGTLDSTLVTETRTVAWKRFDLDDPAFEHLVSDFISKNLNCCNTCRGNTTSGEVTKSTVSAPTFAPPPAPAAGRGGPKISTEDAEVLQNTEDASASGRLAPRRSRSIRPAGAQSAVIRKSP